MRLTDAHTRVLLAVMWLTSRGLPCTVSEIGGWVGMDKSRTYRHLVRLRETGLVDWPPRTAGTIRALVRSTGIGART